MKLFRFDQKIGKFRVLLQTRDIADGAVKGRHIADGAVTGDKIGNGTVEGRSIVDGAVDGAKIKDNTVTGRNIAPGAIGSNHIADGSITGDEVKPGGVKNGKLADDAVHERNIKDGIVTKRKLSAGVRKILDLLLGSADDLQNQIDSIVIGGHAMSNRFGDDPNIGISQKALTDAFNKIWQVLENITGENMLGISMTVTPSYFIGEEGCDVHVTATTVETNGIFEDIKFFKNGIQIWPESGHEDDGKNVDHVEFDTEISDTSVVKCVAKILGVEYTVQKAITHYNSFWLGAGATYDDVMVNANLIPITNGMRGAYDRSVSNGQYLFVIVGDSLAEGFIRADINGFEIPFTETTETVDGDAYRVFKSVNTYQTGTYNIDING